MKHVVAVGDMKYGSKGDSLVTHALGSCLGLVVYDPQILVVTRLIPEAGKTTCNERLEAISGTENACR